MTPLSSRKAFSLIELLLVVAIIGILASAIIFSLADSSGAAQEAVIKADIKNAVTNSVTFGAANNNSHAGLCGHDTMEPFKNKYSRTGNDQSNWACDSTANKWAFAIIAEETWVGGDDAGKARIYCVDSGKPNVAIHLIRNKTQGGKKILATATSEGDLKGVLFASTACSNSYTG